MAEPSDKYSKYRSLFKEQTPGAISIDNGLKLREQALNAVDDLAGMNGDAPPQEYYKLQEKMRHLYQIALAYKYLPRKGKLDINKVPQDRRVELLKLLSRAEQDELELPKGSDWIATLDPQGRDAQISMRQLASGLYGRHAADSHSAGKIHTYGDVRSLTKPDQYTLPGKQSARQHYKIEYNDNLDSDIIDKTFNPYIQTHNGAVFRTVDGQYLYPSKTDAHNLVYEDGRPFFDPAKGFLRRDGSVFRSYSSAAKHSFPFFEERDKYYEQ